MLNDPTYSLMVVRLVDCALKGSQFGVEGWIIVRKLLKSGREPNLDEFNQLEELVDRALDDVKGPMLRVDLSRERVY